MTDNGNQVTTGDESETSMWKFQWLFVPQVADKAQQVFNNLDNKLNPRLFLIGIPIEPQGEATACLEPADDCGYQPQFFSGVMQLAQQLHDEQEAKRVFGTPQKNEHQREIPSDAIQRAILQTLSASDVEQGVISYCSLPTMVGNYKVCCVLQLNRDAFHSHHSLGVKQLMSTRLPASLVDSAAVEFLKICSKALREHNGGLDLDALGREPEEILRAAGRELTFRAAHAGGGPMPKVFDALNIISSKVHEGEKAGGEILLVTPEHPDLQILVAFQERITLRDHDAARKILEMAQTRNSIETDEAKRFYLLTTGESIYGIGRMDKDYDRDFSEIYTVRFTGHYRLGVAERWQGDDGSSLWSPVTPQKAYR